MLVGWVLFSNRWTQISLYTITLAAKNHWIHYKKITFGSLNIQFKTYQLTMKSVCFNILLNKYWNEVHKINFKIRENEKIYGIKSNFLILHTYWVVSEKIDCNVKVKLFSILKNFTLGPQILACFRHIFHLLQQLNAVLIL